MKAERVSLEVVHKDEDVILVVRDAKTDKRVARLRMSLRLWKKIVRDEA